MQADEDPIAHGGDLDEARALFPLAPQPWVDLSTGVNPVPYPLPPIPPEAWSRLPSPGSLAGLEGAAARAYGAADASMVVAAPGTGALIALLPTLLPRPARVAILGPTYAEHARAWAACGHEVRETGEVVPLNGSEVAILVNPDNPTGRRLGVDALLGLARAATRRDGLLVVDEAFADMFDEPASLVQRLTDERVVVLRSFGKAYGLAGLRLGFAVAPSAIAARLRTGLGPWAVSGPAIEVGTVALRDEAWLGSARRRLALDAERLDRLLIGAGCVIVGGTPLFRLAEHRDARALFDRLGRAGIWTRRFSQRPGWLRLGLPGSDAAWARLPEALGACG